MEQKCWKLAPSDFAFLWEDCKRCFYLKVVHGFRRPSSPMPKIFTRIDMQMKLCFGGRRTEDVLPGLPGGLLEFSEKWVTSIPLVIPGRASGCFVRGKFDTVIRFDDGTFGVVDFKTCDRNDHHIPLYARQLHAYAFALELAAAGSLCLKPVSRLGLLVFEPTAFSKDGNGSCYLGGGLKWIEIPRTDGAFKQFLAEVLDLLESTTVPSPNPDCGWCHYQGASRQPNFRSQRDDTLCA